VRLMRELGEMDHVGCMFVASRRVEKVSMLLNVRQSRRDGVGEDLDDEK
jgi:hypothetical protein